MLFPQLKNQEGRELDQVQLTGMLMSCVIGIFPAERSRKQPVMIDMCLYLNTRRAAESANIHDTIDYAGAVKEISFILDHCEFLLIETAVEAVSRHFILTYQADHSLPQVEAVIIRISKPSALTHGIVPAVQIIRRREDYQQQPTEVLNQNTYKIHQAADSALHLLVANSDSPILVQDFCSNAANVLPIGKWLVNGAPSKSRTPITLESSMIFTNGTAPVTSPPLAGQPQSASQNSARILLIQSRPS